MILDSSAVVALLRKEPGHDRIHRRLEGADALGIGGPTLFETGMVTISRFGSDGLAMVEEFIDSWRVRVIPFDDRHWCVACEGFAQYGKGRHPARLNLGDCMSYAIAKVAGEPLLFVGNDFPKTDIAPA